MTAYLVSQLTGSLIATRTMQGGQRGLMLALPLLFVGIVARFPAGLAVYWITTSLWTLGQQVVLLAPRRGRAAGAGRGAGAGDRRTGHRRPGARGRTAAPARGRARKRQSRKRKHGRRR